MKLLVLDNYDSFVFNLVHIIRALGYGNNLEVIRNDKITMEEVDRYDKIVLSPGPGIPDEAGVMKALIKHYGASKSILGICLGHQAIAEVYGARLYNLADVLHGVAGEIVSHHDLLFDGMNDCFTMAHYHSWAVDKNSLTNELDIIAEDRRGLVMGIAHKTHDVKGLQFHPESILTSNGARIIQNWLEKPSSAKAISNTIKT